MFGIFNRSHYEDVIVTRVKEIVPKSVWEARYAQINDFEKMLAANGVRILKFFLHISRAEQKERLQKRLSNRIDWKFTRRPWRSEQVERLHRGLSRRLRLAAPDGDVVSSFPPMTRSPQLSVARTVASTCGRSSCDGEGGSEVLAQTIDCDDAFCTRP